MWWVFLCYRDKKESMVFIGSMISGVRNIIQMWWVVFFNDVCNFHGNFAGIDSQFQTDITHTIKKNHLLPYISCILHFISQFQWLLKCAEQIREVCNHYIKEILNSTTMLYYLLVYYIKIFCSITYINIYF